MQNIIKILDPVEAIKIAAGEVIERPAHIVKELIENSIDAKANLITLHIKQAGKELIKITDNGTGMSPADAKLCFAHHATSKINTVQDLSSIATYGFRGEAMSSIASVSHVELITKTKNDKAAINIALEYGKIVRETITNHEVGTTVIITNLFDNIPARKKFLKTDDTEWNLIVTIVQAFALRYPQISFKIFNNEHMAYNCQATEQIKIRCAQLWNNQLHDQLLELELTEENSITVSGVISSMHYHRFGRDQIFTFVNNRWVKNTELSKGILKGYDGVLPYQKFPAAFIFLTINPEEIDVNIHPKKEEIKFLNPLIAQRIVQTAVKNRLSTAIEKLSIVEPTNDLKFVQPYHAPQTLQPLLHQPPPTHDPIQTQHYQKSKITSLNFESFEQKNEPIQNQTIYEQEPYNIIGQFHKTYILIEKNEQLILIDQHAAHERILYERFKANIKDVATVQLLFPQIVKLTIQETALITTYQSALHEHGIIIELFSDHEIIIQATPVQMSAHSAQEIIIKMVQWLQTNRDLNSQELTMQLHEQILTEKACKSSCKAGDTLSFEQMHNIIKELRATENNFCCPHSRPTLWNISLKEIEKHFKRDYVGTKTLF